jgi:hypothetical protein
MDGIIVHDDLEQALRHRAHDVWTTGAWHCRCNACNKLRAAVLADSKEAGEV